MYNFKRLLFIMVMMIWVVGCSSQNKEMRILSPIQEKNNDEMLSYTYSLPNDLKNIECKIYKLTNTEWREYASFHIRKMDAQGNIEIKNPDLRNNFNIHFEGKKHQVTSHSISSDEVTNYNHHKLLTLDREVALTVNKEIPLVMEYYSDKLNIDFHSLHEAYAHPEYFHNFNGEIYLLTLNFTTSI